MSASRTRRSRGFTLLEILVAFTLFAMVAVPALAVMRDATRAAALSADRARAVSIARSRLEELRVARRTQIVQPAVYGVVESGGQDYEWAVDVAPYVDEALGEPTRRRPNLDAVTVTVSWTRGGRTRSVALDTLVLAEP